MAGCKLHMKPEDAASIFPGQLGYVGCVADEAVLGRMRFPNARDAPLVDAKALCSAAPLQWNATVCNSAKLY